MEMKFDDMEIYHRTEKEYISNPEMCLQLPTRRYLLACMQGLGLLGSAGGSPSRVLDTNAACCSLPFSSSFNL